MIKLYKEIGVKHFLVKERRKTPSRQKIKKVSKDKMRCRDGRKKQTKIKAIKKIGEQTGLKLSTRKLKISMKREKGMEEGKSKRRERNFKKVKRKIKWK